jgi:hypothetical protein
MNVRGGEKKGRQSLDQKRSVFTLSMDRLIPVNASLGNSMPVEEFLTGWGWAEGQYSPKNSR